MRLSDFCFENFYGPFVERLRFGEIAHFTVSLGEIVHDDCGMRMVSPKRFLTNFQRALVKRYSLGAFAHVSVQRREVAKAVGRLGMIGTVIFLAIFQDLFGNWHRIAILACFT